MSLWNLIFCCSVCLVSVLIFSYLGKLIINGYNICVVVIYYMVFEKKDYIEEY